MGRGREGHATGTAPTKYMGSEHNRDREKGTLEIVQPRCIQNTIERFGITKPSPIAASRSLDLRHVNDVENVMDAKFRELMGSLMELSNQTRPDVSDAVRAIMRFSHYSKEIHANAARNLKYFNSLTFLSAAFRRERKWRVWSWSSS